MKTALLLLALLLTGTVQAQGWASSPGLPETIFSGSLDVGGVLDSPNPLIIGGTASIYGAIDKGQFWGAGVGLYSQEDHFAAELELKYSLLGLAGAGIGIALQESDAAIMTDVWANAVFFGVRFRTVFASTGPHNSVMVFVPLLPLVFLGMN